ncbi:MAG: cyclic nucleotide-binding domain-containing protein [Nitrospinaceae bacterium]|nr:cyclic nucleotide-binding domain-containing protein [Nitrospina sp.]MBT5376444.1 cyclic nucleotide-binding domain-containing protein [Nitrospinaceae bacterium]MBT5868407.1 cyclic nucleotide-binding domain-containing protein [Nitrospinaceae bacterium]MBT6346161.1 cyclic nucleotide-binding domain-containing protein [Nitrospina sp.]
MEKNPILDFIERLPFFKEFSADEKSKLVNTSGIFEKFKTGETIISEGDTGSALFVVLTGSIQITKSIAANVKDGHISLQEPEEISIAELKAGSIFGEISLISDQPRNTSARAASAQVVVMKITKDIIEHFSLVIQKKFQSQLINILVQRLDDMNTKYIKLKSNSQKN